MIRRLGFFLLSIAASIHKDFSVRAIYWKQNCCNLSRVLMWFLCCLFMCWISCDRLLLLFCRFSIVRSWNYLKISVLLLLFIYFFLILFIASFCMCDWRKKVETFFPSVLHCFSCFCVTKHSQNISFLLHSSKVFENLAWYTLK